MRAVSSLVAVAALAVAVTSACGQEQAPGSAAAGSASPTAAPSTAATVPASGGCGSSPAASGSEITVGAGDNGKVLCVKQGTEIMVILRGTLQRKWTPIKVSSTALTPRASGGLTLMVGATGASFTAAHAGTSVISSARPACAGAIGGPVSSGSPGTPGGTMHCNVMVTFHLTVVVSG